MDFVKIRGKDIDECLMQVKMNYGPEAHVYNQRVILEGGLMGTKLLAKKLYEVEIGIPEQQASKDRVEKKLKDLKELLRQKTEDESRKKSLNDLKPLTQEEKSLNILQVIEKEKIEEDMPLPKTQLGISLSDEIPRFEVVKQSPFGDSSYLARLYERFQSEGVSLDFLNSVFQKTEKHLSAIDKEKPLVVNAKLSDVLEDRILVDSDLFSGTGRGKRKVIFFVGPTGSGKTTTVAKLAAKYFLHMGRMVSLYTTDNYKIAAIEQLKRYADAMDIPFFAVKDSRKLQEQLNRDGSELILIDTPSISHRSSEFLSRLNQYRESFSEKDSVENILVLPATSSKSHLKTMFQVYETLKYSRILVTKLDEVDSFSSIIEQADKFSKVFTYLSVGQEVPFDLQAANKRLISELFISSDKWREEQSKID